MAGISSKLQNLTGKTFARLTVLHEAPQQKPGLRWWACRCECGKLVVTAGKYLRNGDTKSCGCLHRDWLAEHNPKHLACDTPEYQAWSAMLRRCKNTKSRQAKDYVGRGITVCERWRDFRNFLADMGEKPSPQHSLDRVDNDAGYEKSNCRWATRSEQARNKRNLRWIEFNGRRMLAQEWAAEYGLNVSTLRSRLLRGWPIEKALGLLD